MVLRYDEAGHEAVVCAARGPDADWVRDLRAGPAANVQLGRQSFTPTHRFLTDDGAFDVAVQFRRAHPHRLRLLSTMLGWATRAMTLRSVDSPIRTLSSRFTLAPQRHAGAWLSSKGRIRASPSSLSGKRSGDHSPRRAGRPLEERPLPGHEGYPPKAMSQRSTG